MTLDRWSCSFGDMPSIVIVPPCVNTDTQDCVCVLIPDHITAGV